MPRFVRVIAAALTALTLTIGVSVPMTTHAGDTEHAVQISGFAFVPAELTIMVGDTVTWTNLDSVIHTATSTTGAFDAGDLDQNESYSLTFTAAGTYDYLCTPHPEMTGRIVVQAAAEPAAPTPTPAPSLPNAAMAAGAAGPPIAVAIAVVGLASCALAVSLERRRRT